MFSRSNALLIAYTAIVVGLLYGNIFLIVSGALIATNETIDGEQQDGGS